MRELTVVRKREEPLDCRKVVEVRIGEIFMKKWMNRVERDKVRAEEGLSALMRQWVGRHFRVFELFDRSAQFVVRQSETRV